MMLKTVPPWLRDNADAWARQCAFAWSSPNDLKTFRLLLEAVKNEIYDHLSDDDMDKMSFEQRCQQTTLAQASMHLRLAIKKGNNGRPQLKMCLKSLALLHGKGVGA